MLDFVLIHGSWHTGAHWTPVIGHFHQAGHQAFAPTVLGNGEGVEKRVNYVQQVDDLVNQLIQRNLHDIVLVGLPTPASNCWCSSCPEKPDARICLNCYSSIT